jgi:hypothetical protein
MLNDSSSFRGYELLDWSNFLSRNEWRSLGILVCTYTTFLVLTLSPSYSRMYIGLYTCYTPVKMFPVQLSLASYIMAIIYYAKYDYPVQIKLSINLSICRAISFINSCDASRFQTSTCNKSNAIILRRSH